MPIPVPQRPTPDILARYQANQPASAMHFRNQIQRTNFLRGYAVQPYFSGCYPEPSANFGPTETQLYNLLFIPTPGVSLARVQIETHAFSSNKLFSISAVKIDGADATPITGSNDVFSNNSAPVTASVERLRKTHTMFLDISALDPDTIHTLTLWCYTPVESKGISSISFCECPYAMIDPNGNPTTEPGVNEAWPDARNRIFAGTASTGAGTQRLIEEVSLARTHARQHFQIATLEDDTRCFKRAASGSFGQLDYQDSFGTTYDPTFYMRAKRKSAVNTNAYKLYARYKWAGAAGTALIRATIESSEDNWNTIISTDTTGTINLVNTAGVYTIGEASCTLFLDGAGQRNRITFGVISDTHDLYITNLALIEEET